MSDHQRRLFCRLAFVLCCVLPTCLVGHWVAFPITTRQRSAELAGLLQCPVEIDSVHTPTPNQLRYVGLRLGSGGERAWGEFQAAKLARDENGHRVTLSATDMTLSQFSELASHLCQVAARGSWPPGRLTLAIPRLTIRADHSDLPSDQFFIAKNCTIRVSVATNQTHVIVEFFADQAAAVPIRWEMTCTESTRSVSWSLDTGSGVLPCWLMADAWPAIVNLGGACWFAGRMRGEKSPGESALEIEDTQLLELDLTRLVQMVREANEDATPAFVAHPGSKAIVQRAHWTGGRLEEARVDVHVPGGGRCDAAFLESAKRWLNVAVAEGVGSDPVPFGQLLMGFEIRAGRLSVWGDAQTGLIALTPQRQPLLAATRESQGLSPHRLAGWLSCEETATFPVSTASLELIGRLPVRR
jgi:hypothetical protein